MKLRSRGIGRRLVKLLLIAGAAMSPILIPVDEAAAAPDRAGRRPVS